MQCFAQNVRSLLASTLPLLLLVSCSKPQEQSTVVVYTALDQIFFRIVLKRLEEETGIEVKPIYDTETTKTVGLVNRILAGRDNPQCDVFWNNEIVRMVMLKCRARL